MKIKQTIVLAIAIATAFAVYAAEGTQKPSTRQVSATGGRQGICNAVPYCVTGSTNDYCTPCGFTSCECSDGMQNWSETYQKYCNTAP